jgi:MFS family permease
VATLVATAAPAVLLAPLTGRVSDRYDSRTILLVTAAAQALVCVVMAFWINPYAIVAMTGLLSVGLAFTHPVFGGLPRSIVGPDNVARAASISQVSAMLGMLAAPSLGAFLSGTFGTRWALLFNAVSFVMVVVGALVIKTRLHARTDSGQPAGSAQGGYSVWGDPFIRTLLAATGLVVTCVSINNVASVYLVRETLGASEQVFGIVGSAWMLGLVTGGLVVGKTKRLSSRQQILLAFTCMGVALLLSWTVPSAWWLLPVNIIGGIGNGLMASNLHVILNLEVPEDHRGRAFAALGAVSNAAPMIGYFFGGFLVTATGPRVAYLAIGLATCVCVALVAPALMRGRTALKVAHDGDAVLR